MNRNPKILVSRSSRFWSVGVQDYGEWDFHILVLGDQDYGEYEFKILMNRSLRLWQIRNPDFGE